MSKYTFRIKPSKTIEGYFVHGCERNLFYSGLAGRDLKSFGLERPTGAGDIVAARAGENWELFVVKNYIKAETLLAAKNRDEKGNEGYAKLDDEQTLEFLRSAVAAVKEDHIDRYIYQPKVYATDGFKERWFSFDPALYNGEDEYLRVDFTHMYPDLIRASWDGEGGRVVLSVVDIKLTRRMKLSHKAQVTLYTMLLDQMVKSCGLEAAVDEARGYLWNGGMECEAAFSLKDIKQLLGEFFTSALPGLVKKIRDSILAGAEEQLKGRLESLVGVKCEWCENARQCLGEKKAEGSIQTIPYLSPYAQEYAKKLGAPGEIEGFSDYVKKEENRMLLSANRCWEYILEDDDILEVYRSGVPFEERTGASYRWKKEKSMVLPRWQDVTIFLTAQRYAGDGSVYALGYYRLFYNRETKGYETSRKVFIAKENSEEALRENTLGFVRGLYDILAGVSDYNKNLPTGKYLRSLQGYVMDGYEADNLAEALMGVLNDPTVDIGDLEKIMGILFWIQGERIVARCEQQPNDAGEHPLIAIGAELKKLAGLPLPVAYHLPDIPAALGLEDDGRNFFTDADRYTFFEDVSNVMKSEPIQRAWDGDDTYFERIEKHIFKRFTAESFILRKMQREDKENLVRSAGAFFMTENAGFEDPLLRKWYFEVIYENLLDYSEKRSMRLKGAGSALAEGDMLSLTLKTLPDMDSITVFEGDYPPAFKDLWFSAAAVKAEDEESLYVFSDCLAPGYRPDYKTYNPRNIFFFADMNLERRGSRMKVRTKLTSGTLRPADVGKEFYFFERYTDFNSEKVINALRVMDQGRSLLTRPEEMYADTGLKYSVIKPVTDRLSRCDGFSFTRSQEAAFAHLVEKNITVLQGPPGTGKTDFIARAIVTLCRYFKEEENRNLRVLVSANSHDAINNVLSMVAKKRGESDDIAVYKVERSSPGIPGVERVGDDAFRGPTVYDKMEDDRPMVAGSTGWSCYKAAASSKGRFFDLIIIDEASQVRVMDAMLALGTGNIDHTRYLLVGDDKQLPAIIHGRYGDSDEDAYLYGSVFSYFRERGEKNGLDHCLMLHENFRMNEILVRYSADRIYGDAYTSFNKEIASRRLAYRGTCGAEDFVSYILDGFKNDDEYWPLVLCVIRGATPLHRDAAEVGAVTALAAAMRKTLSANDDHEFWHGGDGKDGALGIVSPHHRHIQRLRDSIADSTGMDRDGLFIGTVDRLQGQQRDAVIVSYGVSDPESAVAEGEFIYSLNRLNVSLTRGKCKTVVFFSENLTELPAGLLDTDDTMLQEGVSFVCGLLPFMERSEKDTAVSKESFEYEVGGEKVILDVYRKRMA